MPADRNPRSHVPCRLCLGLAVVALAATSAPAARGQTADEPGAAELQVDDLSDLSLEELLDVPVVPASGKAEERSLAAANVFVVTREEIEQRGYRSLAEILRHVPGLYLVYDYVHHSVGVREVTGGFRGGTRIVKVMIDGFPIAFRPDLEAFIGPEFIPIEAIERVEVAKGPLSALYGANAFLATVNVITRRPAQRQVAVAGRQLVVNHNGGWGASAVADYAVANRGLLLAVSSDRIDRSGVRVRRTYEEQDLRDPVLAEPTENDLSRPQSAFARFDYRHEALGDFRVAAGHQGLDSGAEFQLNSNLTHRSRVSLYNRWASLNWRRQVGEKFSLRASVGGSHGGTTREYEIFLTGNPTAGYRPQFGYRAFNALTEASYDFGPWLGVDIGADLELTKENVLYYKQIAYRADGRRQPFDEIERIDSDDPRSHNLTQFGTYLQLHSAPISSLPNLRLTGAVREDRIDFGPIDYPLQTSLRGAVAHRFSPLLTTKLIAGRAFQTPSGTLLFAHGGFGNIQNVVGTERLIDPRPLRPQVVTSVELVATSQISDFLYLEGSVYRQKLDDAIRFNQVGAIIVAKNSGSKSTEGGELVANLKLGPLRPYGAISVSRQRSAELTRDLAGITSFTGSPSLYPRLFGYAGFDLEILEATLYLNTELQAAGRRGASQFNFYQNDSQVYDLPTHHVLDLTLSTGHLPLLDRNLGTQVLFLARNVLGNEYFEPGFSGVDIPQPGTSLTLQLRQTL